MNLPLLPFTPLACGLARRQLGRLFLATVIGLAACGSNAQDGSGQAVSLEQAREILNAGQAVVFDIREPAEHARGVAAGMKLLPMSQIGNRISEIPSDPKQPVLLICNTQNRSGKVATALRERGYSNVRYVQGGMSGWVAKGWPLMPPVR